MQSTTSTEGSPTLQVRLWGTRGTIPTPIAANLGHGGNTSCIQILVPGQPETHLIFDAGTGIRALGHSLPHETGRRFHIFFTHFHWDHIQGLPSFGPLFSRNTIDFHSSLSPDELRRVLQAQMTAPCFPIEFDSVSSSRSFHQLAADASQIEGVTIEPFALHHPGGATGYRISRSGATIVYATDHEHGNAEADGRLLHAATNADISSTTPSTPPRATPSTSAGATAPGSKPHASPSAPRSSSSSSSTMIPPTTTLRFTASSTRPANTSPTPSPPPKAPPSTPAKFCFSYSLLPAPYSLPSC